MSFILLHPAKCSFFLSTKHTHADTNPCGSLPVQSLGLQQGDGGMTKKRRKRRRKARPEAGGGRREESGEEFSEDEDMFTIDLSSDEEREAEGSRCVCVCVCPALDASVVLSLVFIVKDVDFIMAPTHLLLFDLRQAEL